ncbi:MAG TPA: WbuC family cupin fold metalloprotein [Geobacteraceae bacterium]|nr:WbuC family cupin fold metalloprotein [Geobacteraceae bacterium]
MKIINKQLLDDLTVAAQDGPRLRKNWNIHPDDAFPAHRLLNAMEPASYIRPHRHLDPLKDETFMIVRGRLGVIVFADDGAVTEAVLLDAGGEILGVDIPSGCFHTAVSLDEGTIFFEAKAGPYLPLAEEEKAPWAPEDASPMAAAYLDSLKNLF